MTSSTRSHSSTRHRNGRPPRQRHATARAAHRGNRAKRWSRDVTQHSHALDLEPDVFKQGTAQQIAESLKRASMHSTRRRGTPFQSAMSMLNFYINRAGKHLPASRRQVLERSKQALRDTFGRRRGS